MLALKYVLGMTKKTQGSNLRDKQRGSPQLLLKDIPKGLQRELGVGQVEEVKFVEISAEVNAYRDAVHFNNSRQLLLQALREGQRVTVLSLTPEEVEETAFSDLRAPLQERSRNSPTETAVRPRVGRAVSFISSTR